MQLVDKRGRNIINFRAPFWGNLKVIVGFMAFVYIIGVLESI
ncbi:MAG: hypothetical protein SOR77_00605 [Peptoniphilus sp.]|nr:hypothetical protein [Peptoniphilus sp.]MDY2986109.1 hypothetical protein [Peptoniphilus sp.]